MKIRLELFDDDDNEVARVQFEGDTWQNRSIQFINMFGEAQPPSEESSSFNLSSQSQNSNEVNTPSHSGVQYPPQHQQVPPQMVPPNYPPVPAQHYYNPMYYPPVYYPSMMPQSPPPMQPTTQAPSMSQPPHVQQGQQGGSVNRSFPSQQVNKSKSDPSLTISERLELFLKYEFPRMWGTSQEIQHQYEQVYGPIKLSTVSTYLSRMYRKGLLQRRGNRTNREYLYVGDMEEQSSVHQSFSPGYIQRNDI